MYSQNPVGWSSSKPGRRVAALVGVVAIVLTFFAPTGSAEPRPKVGNVEVDVAQPLTIVVVGDSVAGQVAVALDHYPGEHRIEYVQSVGARYQADDSLRQLGATVRAAEPDVVVALIGTWDAMSFLDKGGRAFSPDYRTQLVAWRNAIGAYRTPFVWVLMPDIADDDLNPRVRDINRLIDAQHGPASWVGAVRRSQGHLGDTVIRAGDVLDVGGRFVTAVAGSSQQTRSTDGLHLCAAGARLVAEHVLSVDAVPETAAVLEEKYSAKNVPNFLANTPFSSDGCADPA